MVVVGGVTSRLFFLFYFWHFGFCSRSHLIYKTEVQIWWLIKSRFNRSKFHYHTHLLSNAHLIQQKSTHKVNLKKKKSKKQTRESNSTNLGLFYVLKHNSKQPTGNVSNLYSLILWIIACILLGEVRAAHTAIEFVA